MTTVLWAVVGAVIGTPIGFYLGQVLGRWIWHDQPIRHFDDW